MIKQTPHPAAPGLSTEKKVKISPETCNRKDRKTSALLAKTRTIDKQGAPGVGRKGWPELKPVGPLGAWSLEKVKKANVNLRRGGGMNAKFYAEGVEG